MERHNYTFTADEILIYLRKSRSDDPLLSVEDVLQKHETLLNEWIERNIGTPIDEANRYREVVSGETIDDRPEFLKLLKRIESPSIRAIMVVEVQRLSRGDLEDAGRLIKLLRYTNTAVITPYKTYYLEDEYDRDFFERELKRGNEYLEYSKKIMSRGRLLSVSQGNYIGSIAPYGYEKTFITEGKKKVSTLKINETEANVVRLIYDMYVNQNIGRTNIANKLDSMGYKPRLGKHWTSSMIKDILSNIHVTGKVTWNHRKTITVVEDGVLSEKRPRNKECDVYEGKHAAIISDELYNAAQIKSSRNARIRKNMSLRNPLAGLVYCKCGRAMSLRTYKSCAPRLMCDDQTYCNTSSCLYSQLIDMIKDILTQSINDFEVVINNDNKNEITSHMLIIEGLEKKLTELKKKEINLWEKYSDEAMPKDIFDMLHSKVLADKAITEKSLARARNEMPSIAEYEERIERFQNALNALDDPDLSADIKNNLLKACIERIVYSRDKVVRLHGTKSGFAKGSPYSNPSINLEVKLRL